MMLVGIGGCSWTLSALAVAAHPLLAIFFISITHILAVIGPYPGTVVEV